MAVRPVPTEPGRSTRWRRPRHGRACDSFSSPITVMACGGLTRRRTGPACSASTARRSAQRKATTPSSAWGRRPTRWAASHGTSSRTSPAVRPAERVGMRQDVVAPHLVVQAVKPSGWGLLGGHVERPLEPPNRLGSGEAHANLPILGSSGRTPNQGPSLHRLSGTMSPSDACRARPSAGPLAVDPASATGLPCCQSPRAYVLCPLPRRAGRPSCVGVSGRPQRPSSMEKGLGARSRPFEACSGFTRVTARTLAAPPERADAPGASTARSPSPPPRSLPRCTDTSWGRTCTGCVN